MNVIQQVSAFGGGRRPSARRPIARIGSGMGQSNFAGMEGEESNMLPSWQGPQANLRIANYGTYPSTAVVDFVQVNPGVNAWSCWNQIPVGPEQSYMHALQQHFGGTIYFSKIAFGGRSINDWLPGGEFYPVMHKIVRDQERWLLYHGRTPWYAPMLWQQGEADVGMSISTRTAKVLSLIDDYRSISKYTAVQPWMLIDLSALQTVFTSGQRAVINTANANAKAARPFVDTMDPGNIPDIDAQDSSAPGLHYPLVPAMVAIGQTGFNLSLSNGWLASGSM